MNLVLKKISTLILKLVALGCAVHVLFPPHNAHANPPALVRVSISELADELRSDSELWGRRAELMKAVLLSMEYLSGSNAAAD